MSVIRVPVRVVCKLTGKTLYTDSVRIMAWTYEGEPIGNPTDIHRIEDRFFRDGVYFIPDADVLAAFRREHAYVQ